MDRGLAAGDLRIVLKFECTKCKALTLSCGQLKACIHNIHIHTVYGAGLYRYIIGTNVI